MKRLRLFVLALSATFLSANDSPGGLSASTYTVLPSFQIDFERSLVYRVSGSDFAVIEIENCSDAATYCVRSRCGRYSMPGCETGDDFALLWPRACVRHVEVGEMLANGAIRARMVGLYAREIHHTGMRHRELVFAVEGHPDMALIVSGPQLRGFLIDRSGTGKIAAAFAERTLLDESEVGNAEYSDLVSVPVLPHSISGECTK